MATDGEPAAEADDRRTLTDPAMIRALTHPARLAIVEHLGSSGQPATATELAEVVGLSPSATSYHLRAMAKWGLVEEAEGRGDGRERMWRVPGGISWTAEGGGSSPTPELREAGRALVAAVLARADERVTRWFARAADEPAEWDDVVAIFDSQLLVTAAEMAEINAAHQELLRAVPAAVPCRRTTWGAGVLGALPRRAVGLGGAGRVGRCRSKLRSANFEA